MKNVLIFSISALLLGCPESLPERPEISDDCALEYAVSMIDAAAQLTGGASDGEAEACEAAFDAVHLADEGADEQWYEYHTHVWNNLSEGMKEKCGEDLSVRTEFLYEEQILRFRCITECDGHDPDDC